MRMVNSAVASVVALAMVLLAHGCTGGGDGGSGSAPDPTKPVVVVKTNLGEIEIQLDATAAPKTVENFLAYVDSGFYDGTLFHRVIPEFMIQGGGYDSDRTKKPTREPVENEAEKALMAGLANDEGTIAMARTSVPDSATSQFFINVADNEFLNFKSPTPQGYGYSVFGRVIGGMEVVEKIERTPTSDAGGAFRNLPKEPVIIESVKRKSAS